MFKFLVKLAVAALIANGVWRLGSAYLTYYRFEDSVRTAVQYRGLKSDAEIRARILEIAAQDDIPVDEPSLTVQREQTRTVVEGSYSQQVDVLPWYAYTMPFTIHLNLETASMP